MAEIILPRAISRPDGLQRPTVPIVHPGTVAQPTAGLVLPTRITEQRQQEARIRQFQQARENMVAKADGQLYGLSRKVKSGQPLTAAERSELPFLAKVATRNGNGEMRRRKLRSLGLLASQQRGVRI